MSLETLMLPRPVTPRPVPNVEWRSFIPATLDDIEKFCLELRIWRAAHCGMACHFATELLVREGLTNAVMHGCGQDARMRVSCILRAKRGRLVISIHDDGPGFDWRAAWGRRSNIEDLHSRGVEIYRAYADAVRFNSRGNSVVLIKGYCR